MNKPLNPTEWKSAAMQARIAAQIASSPLRTSSSGRHAASFSRTTRAIDSPVSSQIASRSAAVVKGCGTLTSGGVSGASASTTNPPPTE